MNNSKSDLLKYIIIGLLALVVGGLFFKSNPKTNVNAEPSTISGEIDFNGMKPESSDTNNPNGKVILKYKKYNTSDDFRDTKTSVSLADEAPWTWEAAEAGVSYELIAEFMYGDDILISKSNKVTVTAPAHDVALTFNVTQNDLKQASDELIKKLKITPRPEETPAPTPTPELTTVSGNYTVNGYIPTGSIIRTFGRRTDNPDAKFEDLKRDVTANRSGTFSYDQAYAGVTYEYQAELYTKEGTFIGQSPYIKVTAPADHENVVINSTAKPPVVKATISGSIKVNGPVKQNSTLLLLQRKQGDSDYKAITRYPASRQVDFKWTDAVGGTTYELTVALQVNESNTATGNVATVAAPASSVKLELDTNFNLSAPNSKPSVSCGDRDQTNHFNAKISLPQMDGAKVYHLEIGTSAGSNNVFNGQLKRDESKTIYIQGDSPHFTRYSYAACNDCSHDDDTNWSGWSPTLGFQCPQ